MENWSAFAPDFRELEENVEYEERESEFDLEDEDRSLPEDAHHAHEDEEVRMHSKFTNTHYLWLKISAKIGFSSILRMKDV